MDEISRNISILLNIDKNYIPKAEYVFRTFCKILGLKPNFYYDYTPEDIHVYYGPPVEDRRPIEIYYNDKAASMYNKKERYDEKIHFLRYRNENIPFLFSNAGQLFQYTTKSLEIQKDIISSAFFFLSCWQEYTFNRSSQKKPSPDKTLQRQWDFEDIPVVDRYCDIFQKALEKMLPGYQKQMKWSKNSEFAVSISHLISGLADNTEKNAPLKKQDKNNKEKDKKVKNKLKTDRLISPSRLMTQIKKTRQLEPVSEFFLPVTTSAAGNKKPVHDMEPHVSLILTNLSDKTIGLCSQRQMPAKTIKESSDVYAAQGFIAQGYYLSCLENHYHGLIDSLDQAGLKYDISIGYCDSLGFRAGISYPYYPFNLEENKPFSVLEIPTVINNSNFDTIGLKNKSLINHMNYLLRDAFLFKTHLGMIWNHSAVQEKNHLDFPYYLKLLNTLERKTAWLCSPHEIFNYWIDR